MDLWARQLLVDAAAKNRGAVAGDMATLQIIWDRAGHTAAPAAAGQVDAGLRQLGAAASAKDFKRAAAAATALQDTHRGIRTPSG
jgi:hypothetical protein